MCCTRQVVATLRSTGEFLLAYKCQQRHLLHRLGLFQRVYHPITGLGHLRLAGGIHPTNSTAHQHIKTTGHQLLVDGCIGSAVRSIGIEGSRRSVLQMGGYDQPRRQSLVACQLHHRRQLLTLGSYTQRSIIRLSARGQGCTGCCRVGHTIIGRAGCDQRNRFSTLEGRRAKLLLNLHHRDMRQAHTITNEQNHISHTSVCLHLLYHCHRQQHQHKKGEKSFHNTTKLVKKAATLTAFLYLYKNFFLLWRLKLHPTGRLCCRRNSRNPISRS